LAFTGKISFRILGLGLGSVVLAYSPWLDASGLVNIHSLSHAVVYSVFLHAFVYCNDICFLHTSAVHD